MLPPIVECFSRFFRRPAIPRERHVPGRGALQHRVGSRTGTDRLPAEPPIAGRSSTRPSPRAWIFLRAGPRPPPRSKRDDKKSGRRGGPTTCWTSPRRPGRGTQPVASVIRKVFRTNHERAILPGRPGLRQTPLCQNPAAQPAAQVADPLMRVKRVEGAGLEWGLTAAPRARLGRRVG